LTLEGRPFGLLFVGRSTCSTVAAMTELRLRDATFCFDGRVLEVFGYGREGSARYRVEMLTNLTIGGDSLNLVCFGPTTIPYIFDESQRPQVEQLVRAVASAHQQATAT
jgi:hypothetical protein